MSKSSSGRSDTSNVWSVAYICVTSSLKKNFRYKKASKFFSLHFSLYCRACLHTSDVCLGSRHCDLQFYSNFDSMHTYSCHFDINISNDLLIPSKSKVDGSTRKDPSCVSCIVEIPRESIDIECVVAASCNRRSESAKCRTSLLLIAQVRGGFNNSATLSSNAKSDRGTACKTDGIIL